MAQANPKTGEEVKSLIVGPDIHQRLKAFCKVKGFLIRPFVEKIISEALDAQDAEKAAATHEVLHG